VGRERGGRGVWPTSRLRVRGPRRPLGGEFARPAPLNTFLGMRRLRVLVLNGSDQRRFPDPS